MPTVRTAAKKKSTKTTSRTKAPAKGAATRAKTAKKRAEAARRTAPRVIVEEKWVEARFAAPRVRLGMTANEVRDCAGKPECIVFGSDDHVEWQFGKVGVDPQGAPTLYVTTLSFAAGRVVRITEKMTEAP